MQPVSHSPGVLFGTVAGNGISDNQVELAGVENSRTNGEDGKCHFIHFVS